MRPGTSNNTITIDGAGGEGGGQMLRTALSLSMVTGKPFRIKNIRANRKKSGLLRQHLTAVRAATMVCSAKTTGAELGSEELNFIPGETKGGDYSFAIGTAGSTTLVAQTVIPALMLAAEPSTVSIEGGTHNMQSPPYDSLKRSFLPLLEKMGVTIEAEIHSYGFYPVGGGRVSFNITPAKELQPIELMSRGEQKHCYAEAWFANMNVSIAKRELATVAESMKLPEKDLHIRQVKNAPGTGNIVMITMEHENLVEVAASFGRTGVKAEVVAEEACAEAKSYLNSDAAVGVFLADQLLLPMAIAGEGRFTTMPPGRRARTNIEVIKQFIPCRFDMKEQGNIWEIAVNRDGQ